MLPVIGLPVGPGWIGRLVHVFDSSSAVLLARGIPSPSQPLGTGGQLPCHWRVDAPASGSTAALNALIARVANRLLEPAAICLAGTFRAPILIQGKTTRALLVLESAPGVAAVVAPGLLRGAAAAPDGTEGALEVLGSRGVVVRGIRIEHVTSVPQVTPAGIVVEVSPGSACLVRGPGRCGDIALVDDVVDGVRAPGDLWPPTRRACGSAAVDGYGIEVFDAAAGPRRALTNVALVGDLVENTRIGQSETVAISGNVADALVAHTQVLGSDNIGIDVEGFYGTTARPHDVALVGDEVAVVDSWTNAGYGHWSRGRCAPGAPSAAGIYDDGAAWLLIARDRVVDTNQGVSLDTETPGHESDHVVIADTVVSDGPSVALPAGAREAARAAGLTGVVAQGGRAFDALYIDAFGRRTSISDVVVVNDRLDNESTFWSRRLGSRNAVVLLGGRWWRVDLIDLVASAPTGSSAATPFQLDRFPVTWRGSRFVCVRLDGGPPVGAVSTPATTQATLARSLGRVGRTVLTGCRASSGRHDEESILD